MFENLLGQPMAAENLIRDIKNNTLPGSLLFEGPEYSGKCTAALELARALTCREKGAWDCSCLPCEQNRLLAHPYVLLLGNRGFAGEIEASARALVATGSDASRYLYIRNVRKLLRRFDPVLWENDDKKISQAIKHIERSSEIMETLSPEKPLPEAGELENLVAEVRKSVRVMAGLIPSGIPINQIRNVAQWSWRTSPGSRKIVILENADRIQEGARNALLKILEEPPRDLYLVLLTSQKRMIIPTILSRVRPYGFSERDPETVHGVLERVYREKPGSSRSSCDSLREYFIQFRDYSQDQLDKSAALFLAAVRNRDLYYPGTPFEKIDRELFSVWLETLTGHLYQELRTAKESLEGFPLRHLEDWEMMIRKARESADLYNQSPTLLMESLYYGMRDSQ